MYQEATIANLFEVLTYYETACEALGESVLDLVDWAVRKVMHLISRAYSSKPSASPAPVTPEEAVKGTLSRCPRPAVCVG